MGFNFPNSRQEQIKKKALEYGCHLISVLWVAEVETSGQFVDEARFPFTDKPPELKPKRFRNMVEEETIRTPEKKRVSQPTIRFFFLKI